MKVVTALQRALEEHRPLIDLVGDDEPRALEALAVVGEAVFPGLPLRRWSLTAGLRAYGEGATEPAEPCGLESTLAQLAAEPRPGLTVLLGPLPELGPGAVRALRDLYYAWREELPGALVRLGPERPWPPELERLVAGVPLGSPEPDELEGLCARLAPGLTPGLREQLAHALSGLSLDQAEHVVRGLAETELDPAQVLSRAFQARSLTVSQAGALRFVPPEWSLADIGGLGRLKDWLRSRSAGFSRQALAAGHPVPRGVLLMGVSGCGKSFAAKAISSLWSVPLFRLDMSLVYAGLHGSPEAVFHGALAALEVTAPCVLWIDEIENGLSTGGKGETSGERLFSTFLTWLQEKPPLVFVAATANRIELLPPELLRKGRFDQVFFCDLPSDDERREILEIHLRLEGHDPAALRLDYLVADTKGWSGAELAEAVAAASLDASAEARALEERDVARAVRAMVPLSRTMHEKIRALREWAHGRAAPAAGSAT